MREVTEREGYGTGSQGEGRKEGEEGRGEEGRLETGGADGAEEEEEGEGEGWRNRCPQGVDGPGRGMGGSRTCGHTGGWGRLTA